MYLLTDPRLGWASPRETLLWPIRDVMEYSLPHKLDGWTYRLFCEAREAVGAADVLLTMDEATMAPSQRLV